MNLSICFYHLEFFGYGHLPSASNARTCITHPHKVQVDPYSNFSQALQTDKRRSYSASSTRRIFGMFRTSFTIFSISASLSLVVNSHLLHFAIYLSVIATTLIFGILTLTVFPSSEASRAFRVTFSGSSNVL